MADTAEILTFVVILLATLGLLILNRLRTDKKLRAKLAEAVDDLEDKIEDATGLEVELSEVVEEVLDSVADKAEEVLEDLKEDGDLDTDEQPWEPDEPGHWQGAPRLASQQGCPCAGKRSRCG